MAVWLSVACAANATQDIEQSWYQGQHEWHLLKRESNKAEEIELGWLQSRKKADQTLLGTNPYFQIKKYLLTLYFDPMDKIFASKSYLWQ